MKKPVWWWLATWFGSGLSPVMSGTAGSLAALPFAYAIQIVFGNDTLFVAALVIFVMGCWASQQFVEQSGKGNDPGEIVVDEVAGMWLVLSMLPLTLQDYIIGFIAFRIFDIIKPWPVSWADRKVKGGVGVMFDDVLAAIYASIACLIFNRMFI